MADLAAAIRAQLGRQVAHWATATSRLQKPADLASEAAWSNLERYLGVTLRQHLALVVEKLQRHGAVLRSSFDAARSLAELEEIHRRLLDFPRRDFRPGTTIDFYAH